MQNRRLGGVLGMIALSFFTLCMLSPAPNAQGPADPSKIEPGCLQIWNPDGKPGAFCPLKGTEVSADVAGFGARVTVRQTFTNPSKTPVEAIYTFPLPADAAVDRMRMKIGERVVEGIVKRREEARRIYEAAKRAGQAAALLDQERPNIFTQSVANLMPGEQVEIEISYVQLLKYEDGWFEFSYPMVVGPRFLGNAPDPGKVAPPIVVEGKRTGATIDLRVEIDAGTQIEDVRSVLHEIDTQRTDGSRVTVRLARKDEIPNKDFILRYRAAGNTVRSALLTHADRQRGGFFTLVLLPPTAVEPQWIAPKEMIFVIDQSGSQSGFPIAKSIELSKKLIETMNPNDTFNVLGFSNQVNALWPKPRPNSPANRVEAIKFVSGLQANGGTQLRAAVEAALKPAPDPKRLRVVLFNTDGFVGDEFAILDSIQKHRGHARMFTFGIGNSVNRFLIDGMSAEGRGDSEIVTLAADSDKAVERFAQRLNKPVLTDVSVRVDGVPVADVLPGALPDVFSEKPVIVKGRYLQPGKGRVVLSGKLGGEPWSKEVSASFPATDENGSAIATLWAREKIDDLMRSDWMAQHRALNGANGIEPEQRTARHKALENAIVDLALRFGLMTQYTSFVAVEKRVINVGGKQVTVQVPVEMADGVSYEGIFGDKEMAAKSIYRSGAVAGRPAGASGGGFGGAPAALPPTATAPVRKMRTAALREEFDAAVFNLHLLSDPASFDKLKDEEVAAYAGMPTEDERKAIEKLSAGQKERYFRLTRLDKSLWSATGRVEVQIWVRKWEPAAVEALKKLCAAVHLADPGLKAIFATVDAASLSKIAMAGGVAKVLPMDK